MKRLFLLGAGASISHSKNLFPSIFDFFNKANKVEILQRYNRDKYSINDYIKKYFNISKNINLSNINIEQLMTFLEIDINKQHNAENILIRNNIKFLLRDLFIYLHNQLYNDSLFQLEISDYYKLSKLLKEDDFVFTYNWDLLLDNILSDSKANKINGNSIYFNFLEHFTDIVTHGLYPSDHGYINYQKMNRYENKGFFLKLHGSIDWYQCSNKDCKSYGILKVVDDPSGIFTCKDCHEELENVLIPPILNKNYYQYPSIRKIWNVAVGTILGIEELIIWGYSFPPTDFYSQWLLKNAIHLKKVSIINPECILKHHRRSRVYATKIFDCFSRPASFKFFEYFDDYLNNLDITAKYNLKFDPINKNMNIIMK